MILNLHDLKSYSESLAKRTPSIAQRVLLRGPGISPGELKKLSNLVKLPPVYTRCLAEVSLFGVAIGYFSLWPGSIKSANMIDAISNSARENYRGADEARAYDLIAVAQEEGSPICVGSASGPREDTVYLLDIEKSPNVERTEIAPDFERFLLLAGNLHDLGQRHGADRNKAKGKMLECCKHFGCTSTQTGFWVSRMESLCS